MYRIFLEGSEVARIRLQNPSRHVSGNHRLTSGIPGALIVSASG